LQFLLALGFLASPGTLINPPVVAAAGPPPTHYLITNASNPIVTGAGNILVYQ